MSDMTVYYIMLALTIFIVLLLTPFYILVFNLITSFCFYIYKLIYKEHLNTQTPREFWDKPVRILSKFWYIFGKIFHGYEIEGIENIPDSGPAILVLYHPVVPVDLIFLIPNICLIKNRKIIAIIDKFVLKIPGYQSFVEGLEHTPGTIESCLAMLKKNELIAIYPGGTREAITSDSNYQMNWRSDAGFAKLAVQSKVPVIPIFTQNSREITGRFNCFNKFFNNLYNTKKVAYTLIYGWYPVKLKTYIGEPILYDESRTVEELTKLTKDSLDALIKKHQRLPGNVKSALLDRVTGLFASKKKLS